MRKFVNAFLAGALGIAMVAGVAAQDEDSGSATVSVTSDGTLVVVINDVPFDPVDYSFDNETTTNDVVVLVEDNTGSAAGWEVSLSGTDFAEVDAAGEIVPDGESFAITNLALGAGVPVSTEGAGIENITAPAVTVSEDSQQVALAPAGSGMGHYTITYLGTLTVPGGTLVGDYQSTLTVTMNAAP